MRAQGIWRKAAAVLLAAAVAFGGLGVSPGGGTAHANPLYNYAEALQKSLFFYEAQRSGYLPADNRVSWRGNSHTRDGQDQGVDLTGGWYDAGDDVKWSTTMSFAASNLAWGAVEYRNGYINGGQMAELKRQIKWVTDYYLKAFTYTDLNNIDTYKIYTEVGSIQGEYPPDEHGGWFAHEMCEIGRTSSRPVWYADKNAPATPQVAAMAATMAATAYVFRENSSGPADITYADLLLARAEKLFQFADAYRAMTTHDPTGAVINWPSYHYDSEYWSELAWAALWLHRAQNQKNSGYGNAYLTKASAFASNFGSNNGFYYSSYIDSVRILLVKLTGDAGHKSAIEARLDDFASRAKTPGGMSKMTEFGALRETNNTAFLAFVYGDWLPSGSAKKTVYLDWAKSQLHYALGSNPANRSYLAGFQPPGKSVVRSLHHRTAQAAFAGYEHLIFTRPEFHNYLTRHTLYGALAGGPNYNDYWFEGNEPAQHEVTLDFNTGITGNLARMVQYEGGTPLAGFPAAEPRDNHDDLEYFVDAVPVDEGANYTTIKAELNNRSRWPAKYRDQMSFRYYFTLESGVSASQITATLLDNGGGGVLSGPTLASGSTYYLTVSFPNIGIFPADRVPFNNFDPKWRRTVKFKLQSSGAWNASNDWSYYGLNRGTVKRSRYIPVYDNGAKLYGFEPGQATQNDAPQAPAGAFIVGSGHTPPTSQIVNLTEEGGLDWAHWSRTYTVQNRKASGNKQISDLTRIGSQNVGRSTDGIVNFSWYDGTTADLPNDQVVTEYGTKTETFQSGVGNGFGITVPADTQPRTLRVYVGGFNSRGTLTATLSDGSAPAYSVAFSNWHGNEGHYSKVITLSYRAASANQTLSVQWVQTEDAANSQFGKVFFNAATLNMGYTQAPDPDYAAPQPPSNVTTSRSSVDANYDKVYLTWTPSGNARYYTVYRSDNANGPFRPILAPGTQNDYLSRFVLDEDRFVDLTVPKNQTVYYKVSATNFAGESAMVPAGGGTNDTQAPTAPSNLASPSKTDTTVSLTWSPSTDNVGVTGYDVYYGSTKANGSPVAGTAYTVTGLSPNTAYSFTVRARDAAGNTSAPSAALAVTTNPAAGLPSGWSTQNVGSVGQSGSASHSAGTFTVGGSGADIWDASDGFRYVYRSLAGDGTVVARVVSQQNTNAWAKAGLMIRETLNADSKHASVFLTPGNGVHAQYRGSTGGVSTDAAGAAGTAPVWLKLERAGGSVKAYRSADGTNWGTPIATMSVSMTANVYAGLAVTSHDNGATSTAQFSDVSVTSGGADIPIANPGFETGTISGWTEWHSGPVSYGVDGHDVRSGSYKLYLWNGSAYEQKIYQGVTGLQNGSYTVKAWVKLQVYGGTPSAAQMIVSDFGGTNQTVNIAPGSTYQQISSTVNVVNGQITFGFYVHSPGSTSLQVDDVTLTRN